jgi:hypothetical protein
MKAEQTIFDQLRDALQPRGSANIVRLFLNGSAYFEKEFVDRCIEELENIPVMNAVGQPASPLQVLAFYVLRDSAYIEKVAVNDL